MKLDVPYIPEGQYPQFLRGHREHLGCVHFSLHDPALSDARQLTERKSIETICSGLTHLHVPTYVLMNSRLHAPDAYFSKDGLEKTAKRLTELVETVNLNGIIFADFYYLNALSDAHPSLAKKLEAVPSINALLSSAERVYSALDLIKSTHFRMPSKLVLDRGLNRDMKRLETTSTKLRKALPKTELYLMANEGCLLECPFKPAHDAHIALVNQGLAEERTFAMNHDFGCVSRMVGDTGNMLISPFIRPEDVDKYDGIIDGIKICGRNHGPEYLERAVSAYIEKRYDGNLLNLMDTMTSMADRIEIQNRELPDAFFERVTRCDKQCHVCGWCADVAQKLTIRHKQELHRL